jgi:hypothetical protein
LDGLLRVRVRVRVGVGVRVRVRVRVRMTCCSASDAPLVYAASGTRKVAVRCTPG